MKRGFYPVFSSFYPELTFLTFSVAHRSPEEIIVHLRETCEGWSKGRSLDDDVTFVVMKMNARTESG